MQGLGAVIVLLVNSYDAISSSISGRMAKVTLRPIRPEHEPLMVKFHETLSDRSVYLRYFSSLSLSARVAHERLSRICFVWPDKETVTDRSQVVQLAKIEAVVRYWGTDYDWRKTEAKLNALSQFVTEIDGLDIHFIHVRSRHPNAMPLIITHGWPGSGLEIVKVIGPLTDPTVHGGRAQEETDF